MYSKLYFWILSGDCGNCFLKKNILKIILYLFIFVQKPVTSIAMVDRGKLSNLSLNNIFSVLSIGLPYTLSFKWPDFCLKFRVTIMPKGQSLKFKVSVLYEIFPFLKQAGIVIHVLNLKIVTELLLWNRKRGWLLGKTDSWACTFWTSYGFSGHRILSLA